MVRPQDADEVRVVVGRWDGARAPACEELVGDAAPVGQSFIL